ncbi:MAG: alpha-(1-_3)-arabinofuranosyltransferase domain-containing protein, partial [Acidimicrobiales bacterium]
VDPITPGLIDRPYVARELIPYGSDASADLLIALDRRLQENVLEPQALAPIARLMGVGDVVVRNDMQYERYRAARPYDVSALVAEAGGLGPATAFGSPRIDRPDPRASMFDERAIASGRWDGLLAPVLIFPVNQPVPIIRTKSVDRVVILAGSGEGIVSAATAGVLGGDELIKYAAAMTGAELTEASGSPVILTDSNRRRGRRWQGVRENAGFTEGVDEVPLRTDLSDNRLEVFPPDPSGRSQSVVVRDGGVVARATSYGNAVTFTPEHRAMQAVDGDPATVWRTGAERDVRGERLVLEFDPAVEAGEVRLQQLRPGASNRSITAVDLIFDGVENSAMRVGLGPESQAEGTIASFPTRRISRLDVVVADDSSGRRDRPFRPARYFGLDSVGFAEISVAGRRGTERVRLPTNVPTPTDRPLSIVLERLRADPSERVRSDEEIALRRVFQLDGAHSLALTGGARVSAVMPDDAVDALLFPTAPGRFTSSRRLTGDLVRRARSAFDSDLSTAWTPGFGSAADWVRVEVDSPVTLTSIAPVVVDKGVHSLPRQLTVTTEVGPSVVVDLPQVAADGEGIVRYPPITLARPLTGSAFRFDVSAVQERTTTEWFSGTQIAVPVAIAEFGAAQLTSDLPDGDRLYDSGCRNDLLTVDGRAVPVAVTGTIDVALNRQPLSVRMCGGPLRLGPGTHTLDGGPGQSTGIDLDRLLLNNPQATTTAAIAAPPASVIDTTATSAVVEIAQASAGEPFWLVLGQSSNDGWRLRVRGATVGDRMLVDGYANGWLVTPVDDGALRLSLEWTPQRAVDRAIVVSALAVGLCLVLLRWPRRTRCLHMSMSKPALIYEPALIALRSSESALPTQATLLIALASGALADMVIGPIPAVVTAAAALVAARAGIGGRVLMRFAGPAFYAVAAAYVVLRQAKTHPTPAFEWPAELSAVHGLALTAVALLAVTVVVDRARSRHQR